MSIAFFIGYFILSLTKESIKGRNTVFKMGDILSTRDTQTSLFSVDHHPRIQAA